MRRIIIFALIIVHGVKMKMFHGAELPKSWSKLLTLGNRNLENENVIGDNDGPAEMNLTPVTPPRSNAEDLLINLQMGEQKLAFVKTLKRKGTTPESDISSVTFTTPKKRLRKARLVEIGMSFIGEEITYEQHDLIDMWKKWANRGKTPIALSQGDYSTEDRLAKSIDRVEEHGNISKSKPKALIIYDELEYFSDDQFEDDVLKALEAENLNLFIGEGLKFNLNAEEVVRMLAKKDDPTFDKYFPNGIAQINEFVEKHISSFSAFYVSRVYSKRLAKALETRDFSDKSIAIYFGPSSQNKLEFDKIFVLLNEFSALLDNNFVDYINNFGTPRWEVYPEWEGVFAIVDHPEVLKRDIQNLARKLLYAMMEHNNLKFDRRLILGLVSNMSVTGGEFVLRNCGKVLLDDVSFMREVLNQAIREDVENSGDLSNISKDIYYGMNYFLNKQQIPVPLLWRSIEYFNAFPAKTQAENPVFLLTLVSTLFYENEMEILKELTIPWKELKQDTAWELAGWMIRNGKDVEGIYDELIPETVKKMEFMEVYTKENGVHTESVHTPSGHNTYTHVTPSGHNTYTHATPFLIHYLGSDYAKHAPNVNTIELGVFAVMSHPQLALKMDYGFLNQYPEILQYAVGMDKEIYPLVDSAKFQKTKILWSVYKALDVADAASQDMTNEECFNVAKWFYENVGRVADEDELLYAKAIAWDGGRAIGFVDKSSQRRYIGYLAPYVVARQAKLGSWLGKATRLYKRDYQTAFDGTIDFDDCRDCSAVGESEENFGGINPHKTRQQKKAKVFLKKKVLPEPIVEISAKSLDEYFTNKDVGATPKRWENHSHELAIPGILNIEMVKNYLKNRSCEELEDMKLVIDTNQLGYNVEVLEAALLSCGRYLQYINFEQLDSIEAFSDNGSTDREGDDPSEGSQNIKSTVVTSSEFALLSPQIDEVNLLHPALSAAKKRLIAAAVYEDPSSIELLALDDQTLDTSLHAIRSYPHECGAAVLTDFVMKFLTRDWWSHEAHVLHATVLWVDEQNQVC